MKPIRVALIDDEKLILDYLERQFLKIEGVEIVGKFMDPVLEKERICNTEAEAVFLDIQFPGMNGMKLAEQLLRAKPHLKIVFITAHTEYAVKAFELNAIDYLVKPITFERLHKPIRKIREGLR